MHRSAHINSKINYNFTHATITNMYVLIYIYADLSGFSGFLPTLAPPNKDSFKVKAEFNSRDHVSNS